METLLSLVHALDIFQIPELVKLLLEHPSAQDLDLYATDNDGDNFLHCACFDGSKEVVKTMILML